MLQAIFVMAVVLGLTVGDALAQGCRPEEVWNGYRCQPASPPGSCSCGSADGSRPQCVQGSRGWWYVHVGGQQTTWTEGTDAQCCTARASDTSPLGGPAGWGGAPCVSAGTREACEQVLRALGCGPFDREAGPLFNQAEAASKCPGVCGPAARWTGEWRTTVPGHMSVCGCEPSTTEASVTAYVPAPSSPSVTPAPLPPPAVTAIPSQPPTPAVPIVPSGPQHLMVAVRYGQYQSGWLTLGDRASAKLGGPWANHRHPYGAELELFQLERNPDGTYLIRNLQGAYVDVVKKPDFADPVVESTPTRAEAEPFAVEPGEAGVTIRSTTYGTYLTLRVKDHRATDGGVSATVELKPTISGSYAYSYWRLVP